MDHERWTMSERADDRARPSCPRERSPPASDRRSSRVTEPRIEADERAVAVPLADVARLGWEQSSDGWIDCNPGPDDKAQTEGKYYVSRPWATHPIFTSIHPYTSRSQAFPSTFTFTTINCKGGGERTGQIAGVYLPSLRSCGWSLAYRWPMDLCLGDRNRRQGLSWAQDTRVHAHIRSANDGDARNLIQAGTRHSRSPSWSHKTPSPWTRTG